jgi:hypothetical protein
MTEQTELKTTGDETAEAAEVALEKRRRLLKFGVSAAPVVLTLASRSALACHCKSPSAAGSATFNSHKPAGTDEDGTLSITSLSYGQWMGQASLPGSVTKTTLLKDIPQIGTAFATNKTKQIQNLASYPFERAIVTAYLNLTNTTGSNSGATIQANCLTMIKLKAMASGTYNDPTTGVSMSSSQIQAYLENNWLGLA